MDEGAEYFGLVQTLVRWRLIIAWWDDAGKYHSLAHLAKRRMPFTSSRNRVMPHA
jgi:hypothetical protein